MSKIIPVPGWVVILPFDKLQRGEGLGGNPFSNMVASNNLGTVKYVANVDEKNFPQDLKVYFGTNYERMLMEGVEVLVMKTENILAKVFE